jgi:hypothetical protein
MVTVNKVNKFVAEQKREIAKWEEQNHTRNYKKKKKKLVTPIKT